MPQTPEDMPKRGGNAFLCLIPASPTLTGGLPQELGYLGCPPVGAGLGLVQKGPPPAGAKAEKPRVRPGLRTGPYALWGQKGRCWDQRQPPSQGSLPAHSCAGCLGDTGAPVCGEGLHGRKGAQVRESRVFQAGAGVKSGCLGTLARGRGRTGRRSTACLSWKGLKIGKRRGPARPEARDCFFLSFCPGDPEAGRTAA